MGKRKDDPPVAEAMPLALLPAEQLFLCEAWEESPRLVERVKEFIHTGRHAIRDSERSRDIIEAVLNGASKSLVANTFRVGRQTVTAIYRLMEESGQLLQIKMELRNRWLDVWRLSMWRTQEHLHRGTMPAQVLPALNGIASDKINELSHLMPEDRYQKTIDVKARSVLDALTAARSRAAQSSADGPPSDCASDEAERKALPANVSGGGDTVSDTADWAADGSMTGAERRPGGAGNGIEGGGGDRSRESGAGGRVDGSEKS